MPAKYKQINVTYEFLNSEPSAIFVYDDNLTKQGLNGTAALRNHPRTIGFVTQKAPEGVPRCCFKPEEYVKIFFDVLEQISMHISKNTKLTFYIPKLGSGYANKYFIWETLIHHNLVRELEKYDNVVFCWEQEKLTSD